MKRILLLTIAFLMGLSGAEAAQIQNVYARSTVSLNGDWRAFADPQEIGSYNYHSKPLSPKSGYFADRNPYTDRTKLVEYDFASALRMRVPGDWNTQYEKLYYYEGCVWYERKLDYIPQPGERIFLYFSAVNYSAEVGLNGEIIGSHRGGFTPFCFEITDKLKPDGNSLVVKVDNKRSRDAIPTLNFDWWNYGGIIRDVMLVRVPETFIRDYFISLDKDNAGIINVDVQLDGVKSRQKVKISIPELGLEKTFSADESGKASVKIKAFPQLWSPDSPKLYDVLLSSGEDSVKDRIGFRTISVKGDKILLNGQPIFLKGACVHDETVSDNPGRISTREQARKVLAIAKDMGCNFLRLAHYPHNELTVRAAEEMGIMLWEEIPCYWAIDWENPDTYENARTQLEEMIVRDKNRANTIIWSVANETPKSDARLKFLSSLIAQARKLDPTRLVSAALLTNYIDKENTRKTVRDELLEYTDLLSFNEYVGWYDGAPEHCDEVEWEFPVKKPVVITEFGGGAKYGLNGPDSHRFTEEHLEKVYRYQIWMFDKMPSLCGLCPWLLKDFRSPRRLLPEIQDEFNRKGLVDENGNRKKAFYVMKDYYTSAGKLAPFPEVSEPYAITSGPKEHLLASYFGINSWSPDGRYVSVLEIDFSGRLAESTDTATVALVDLQDGNRLIPISKTVCWNFQEAAMFHWLPWEDGLCAFNDCRDGKFVTVLLNWKTGAERIIPYPISAVDPSGEWAVSLNYARLRVCRPDYGYAGDGQSARTDVAYPKDDGLFLVNLKTGQAKMILSISRAKDLMPAIAQEDGLAYFCHTIISPGAKRIFFLARTVEGFAKQLEAKGFIYSWDTVSFTVNVDGTDLRRCYPDGWKGSHFNWFDDETLAVTACWDGGDCWAHTVFKVGQEEKVRHIAPGILDWDGHLIFSPDGKFLSTDGYWNKDNYRSWVLVRLEDEQIMPLGRFYVPEKYTEQYSRCDLHPRWRPDGSQLGFNSVHEGSRQVYLRDVKW